MIGLRTLQSSRGAEQSVDIGFAVIWGSLILGITAAVITGWTLTRTLDDTWRRGVVGALSVFGTALLSALGMPADMLGGRAGLIVYLFAMLTAAIYTHSVARRAAST
jgi:hypothetical protein